ncbi:universal stress protein [Dactylosporangium sp. NPDC051485]|uniref:universal stress protein n=1 Tax=Dactylosporangium sp. NPDC051485 TaxID=3154846 RepID=UPI0034274031
MNGTDRPVVVGVDGSPAGLGAVRWAADEAALFDRPLEIVHALTLTGEDEPAADDYGVAGPAADRARAWQPELRVATRTGPGDAARLLMERSRHASLLVVGSRRSDEFPAVPVSFLGVQLAAHAHCPVLVVHDSQHWAGPGAMLPQHRPVLLGTDGSDRAQPAVALAFAEAAARRAGLIAVRAWQEPPRYRGRIEAFDRLAADVEGSLAAELGPWRARYPSVAVEQRTVRGAPAPALLAEAGHALMLVLAARGAGGFDGLRLGSTAQQVLDHASVPVLVARS